ncbi:hypothetical protein MTO98_23715 [Mucilaginibacter sp. SMC90]|uniref:hypothetical protein n=1 Tax=Mucilaginibacter sp. SMC90 TaxID=2929803 RepID=UPI001FB546EE|nr:hypothetical protein [Mucilaginibacter sp. SMC90]UOE47418.1 hypothetical protein MTO98_23715 [Mucilaginibacter sp. SMC90]
MLKLSDSETVGLLVIGGSLDGKDRQQIDELEFHDLKANGQVQLRSNDILKKLHGARARFASFLYINFVHFHGDKNAFAGNTFEGGVELTDCVIDRHLSFSYSTFLGVFTFQKNRIDQADLYFTGCHIRENFWFGQHHQAESTAFSGKLSLLAATVSANSIVGIFRLNESAQLAGELLLKDMLIKGLLDIRYVNVRNLQMQGAVVPGNVQEDGSVTGAVKDRGTARLLKNEAKKINNQIGGLSYYRKEVQAHARELRWRNWEDRLLLLLNQISNNYGTSWSRGVLFTLLSGLLCFTAFWLCAENSLVSQQPANFWATYINFIWLPSGLQGLLDTTGRLHGGIAGVCFFLLGKVLIAYGIYQTIAAFRKYL